MTRPGGPGRPATTAAGPLALLSASGSLIGLAALTRNEALWLGLAWAVVAWTADPGRPPRAARRDRRPRGRRRSSIFAPWAIRDWLVFGNPLPGQAAANALSVDRLRHLRLAGSADAVALPRRRTRPPARDAGRGHRPQPVRASCSCPARRCRSSGWSACRSSSGCASLRPLAPRRRDHVPRHEPALPGLDDLGHVPPRRRPGPRPAGRSSALLALDRADRRGRPAPGLDEPGRLARRRR